MRTIHKYALAETDNLIDTYEGVTFLHVDNQGERITVWAEVDTDRPTVTALLHVVGTGHVIPQGTHIGTAIMAGGAYVFHVYDGAGRADR